MQLLPFQLRKFFIAKKTIEENARNVVVAKNILKSYGYYEGKIDGMFGNVSKNALISFQKINNLDSDGKIGPKTCSLLLNKKIIVKKNKTINVSNETTNPDNSYSQEIYDAQIILKDLGLYSSNIDGVIGP